MAGRRLPYLLSSEILDAIVASGGEVNCTKLGRQFGITRNSVRRRIERDGLIEKAQRRLKEAARDQPRTEVVDSAKIRADRDEKIDDHLQILVAQHLVLWGQMFPFAQA